MSNRVLNLPHDIAITIAQPYSDGYVLSEAEASKLNQVYADSIRSALVAKIKKADSNGTEISPAEFQNFADAYSFTIKTPRASADPVAKEATKIAKEQIFATIRKKGGNPADYTAEQIAEYVAKVLHHKPEIREEAVRRVESAKKLAGNLLSDIFDEAA